MEKIELEIVGLSYSQTQSGAYALVLGEVDGRRRLPIIIGNFEAQAIAIELEQMKPSRPLTHDVFKSTADAFNIDLKEVVIYNLVEGVFFAKLMSQSDHANAEIDARTSDAIALAVRFSCKIYTYEFILATAGIILEEELAADKSSTDLPNPAEVPLAEKKKSGMASLSAGDLQKKLDDALANEDYETASKIRDELNRRQ